MKNVLDVLLLAVANCILLNDKFVVCPLNLDSNEILTMNRDREIRARVFLFHAIEDVSRAPKHTVINNNIKMCRILRAR